MKQELVKLGLLAGFVLISSAVTVKADGGDAGPLVDILVEKGVLTSKEGIEARDQLLKDYKSTGGGTLSLGSPAVKGLKLYGDVRLRYEWDKRGLNTGYNQNGLVTTINGGATNLTQERNRNRYRVRLGAEYLFTDNFKAGVRLATNAGGDHNGANADLGTGSKTWDGTNAVGVDLAYLESDKAFGQDWLTLIAGRQLQPHNIVGGFTWDNDINPDGGLIKLGDFKPFDNAFTVGSTHGIYIWNSAAGTDNGYAINKGTAPDVNSSSDAWLFVNQVDLSYKFSPSWNLRVSPTFITSAGDSSVKTNNSVSTAGTSGGSSWGNPAAFDLTSFNVFLVDTALDTPFFLNNSKGKFYGEYGVNLTADQAARKYFNGVGADEARGRDARNQFFLLGYQISGGGSKGKGKAGWSLDSTYAYYETYSWTGALIDSDWSGGSLNGAGFGLKAAYNFTENITGSVNWRHSGQIDNNVANAAQVLPTGSAATGTNFSNTDLVQVDLVWKF